MKTLLLFFIYLGSPTLSSQNKAIEFAAINIGLNGIVGGIGSVFHSNQDEKIGKVILNGFIKGCAAGSVTYSGKLISGNIGKEDDLKYAWPGKITYWIGNSMMENTALNRPIFEKINMNFGILRLEYNFSNKHFDTKLLPLTTVFVGYVAINSKFEIEKSLASGELIFSSNRFNNLEMDFRGFTLGNVVVMNSQFVNNKSTISHEIIHVFQNNDFNFVNNWINPSLEKNTFFKKTSKYLYYEFNTIVNQGLYWTQYKRGDDYYKNIFEREAATFSDTFRN